MLKRLLAKSTSLDDVFTVVIGVDGASDYKRSVIDPEFANGQQVMLFLWS
jgi:hypothetical protein